MIRVLAELGESYGGQGVTAAARAGDATVDSYRTGADGQAVVKGATAPAILRNLQKLQPKAAEIDNQRLRAILAGRRCDLDVRRESAGRGIQDGKGSAHLVEAVFDECRPRPGHGSHGRWQRAVLLLQLSGRGVRDYVVKLDFTGSRSVTIPAGETSWADGNWGWRFGAKYFDYSHVNSVSLGFGSIPPRTSPKVRIANLRILADVPSKLINPVIHTGSGRLRVHGEIASGCYLRYDGGEIAGVYNRNWSKLKELRITLEDFVCRLATPRYGSKWPTTHRVPGWNFRRS